MPPKKSAPPAPNVVATPVQSTQNTGAADATVDETPVSEIYLNVDGVKIPIAEADLPHMLGRLMTTDGITVSHSRKLNCEDYQKYTSEDFFQSMQIGFKAVWEAIPREMLLSPTAGPTIWRSFMRALNDKLGRAMCYMQKNVTMAAYERARQLGLRQAAHIEKEIAMLGKPGGYDPLGVIPKPATEVACAA